VLASSAGQPSRATLRPSSTWVGSSSRRPLWEGRCLPGEAARFLAQAAQQTGDEESRLEALAALSKYAHKPDVVKACCVGCGKTRKLVLCSKCLTARFCGAECVRRMWPVHKQSCKTFAAAREEAAAAADGGADEHGAAPAVAA